MQVRLAFFLSLILALDCIGSAQTTRTLKISTTRRNEVAEIITGLPECNPAFAGGLKSLITLAWVDHERDRIECYKSVIDCIQKAHLEKASDEQIAEQTFRFAYDHRKDHAIVMMPGAIASLVRQYFSILPQAYGSACMRYLDSPDEEVRNVADGLLEASGMFDVQTGENGWRSFGSLAAFLKDMKAEQQAIISPRFVRAFFDHDPELAWEDFDLLDNRSAKIKASDEDTREVGRILQAHSEYVRYIAWAASQTCQESECQAVDKPLAIVLLRELSRSRWKADRLFAIAMMSKTSSNEGVRRLFADHEIIDMLRRDPDRLVSRIADDLYLTLKSN